EFGLLLGWSSGSGAAGCGSRGHRGRGGDAPLLLQHFREVGGLQHREVGEVVDESLQISHWTSFWVRTSRVFDVRHAAASLLAAEAWTTRATLAAGALTTCAILVAGA